MVVQLNGQDAQKVRRRIRYDVREIAIEGEEYCASFVRFGDDHRVKRADGKNLPQQSGLMTGTPEQVRDLRWHALVAEEAQAHTVKASKSAKSRA